jgi:hypothetical protein
MREEKSCFTEIDYYRLKSDELNKMIRNFMEVKDD